MYQVEIVWVLGGVERSERIRLVLTVVEKRYSMISEAKKKKLKNKSILSVDCWKGYNGINKIFAKH